MNSKDPINMKTWSVSANTEPTVRVGIVLDEDAMTEVHITIPNTNYRMQAEDRDCGHFLNANLRMQLVGNRIAVDASGQQKFEAGSIRLFPESKPQSARGKGICVRNVVAGRGFHWHKLIDQTFVGVLEIIPKNNALVVVNELPLEEYLKGVITSEMSGNCPIDLLKTQCVVARSWLLAMTESKHDNDPFDRCNDDCCQRYQGTGDLSDAAIEGVVSTRGLAIIAPDNTVVDANYSKSCGGVAEPPETVWGISKPGLSTLFDGPDDSLDKRFYPVTEDNLKEFLTGDWIGNTNIYCSPNVVPEEAFGQYLGRVDEAGNYFRWQTTLRTEEIEDLLRRKHPAASDLASLRDIQVTKRGPSGRACELQIEFDDQSGNKRTSLIQSEYNIRNCMHPKFLYSSAFIVETERNEEGGPVSFTLHGAGWGHGAGMCQIGALGMALKGISYDKICLHYFPGCRLDTVYS